MASNHKLSGAQNRKRKNKIFNENKQGAKFMRGFLSQSLEIETDQNSPKEDVTKIDFSNARESEQVFDDNVQDTNDETEMKETEQPGTSRQGNDFSLDKDVTINSSNPIMDGHEDEVHPLSHSDVTSCNLDDIGEWPTLTRHIRDQIIKNGPKKIEGPDSRFPVDLTKSDSKGSRNRKFSLFHCNRKLPNNEKLYRRYLQYSESKNRVYCFSCKLFGNTRSQLGQNGINNWKHIGDYLKDHETSSEHYTCYSKWVDAEKIFVVKRVLIVKLKNCYKKR